MKVTALVPDSLIREVTRYAEGRNLTESLIVALREWLSLKKLSRLNKKIENRPVHFQASFSASKIRTLNRRLS